MNKKLIIGLSIVPFLMGVGIGSTQARVITVEKPVDRIVEKPIYQNMDQWKQLKTLDDKVISVAGYNMGLCSEGLEAASNLDVKKMNAVSGQVNDNTEILGKLADQRNQLVKTLGY